MSAVPAISNVLVALLVVDSKEILNNGTVFISFVVLVIGALSALQRKFDRDVAIAKENSVGATRLAALEKDNAQRDVEIKGLVAASRRSEEFEIAADKRMGVFENKIDDRLRLLELEYIKALKDVASRNPYQNRGLMGRGYQEDNM